MSCGSCRLCFGTKPPFQPPERKSIVSTGNFNSPSNALDTLGEILPRDPGRDAIHIATFAVTSDEKLYAGQHIGFIGDGNKVSSKAAKLSGIVDPFLPGTVFPGQIFWLLLYPRTITSLRHAWTHPDVPNEVKPKTSAQEWMEEFAGQYGFSADRMINAADSYLAHGEYFVDGGTFEGSRVPDEFWGHYESIKGVVVPDDDRDNFFSCSC